MVSYRGHLPYDGCPWSQGGVQPWPPSRPVPFGRRLGVEPGKRRCEFATAGHPNERTSSKCWYTSIYKIKSINLDI